jgi:hypothetical protein
LGDEPLRELLEVQAYFGLPSPALVEKDYYVVKARREAGGRLSAGRRETGQVPFQTKTGTAP